MIFYKTLYCKNLNISPDTIYSRITKVEQNEEFQKLCNDLFGIPKGRARISFRKFISGKDNKLRLDLEHNFFNNDKRLNQEVIEKETKHKCFIPELAQFLCINGVAVGYAQIYYIDGQYVAGNIGILDTCRGIGLGKLMVYKIIQSAHNYGIKTLYLDVNVFNKRAKNIYLECGFKSSSLDILISIRSMILRLYIKIKRLYLKKINKN